MDQFLPQRIPDKDEHILQIEADLEGIERSGREEEFNILLDRIKDLYNYFTDDIVSLGKRHGFCVKAETKLDINN